MQRIQVKLWGRHFFFFYWPDGDPQVQGNADTFR